jgi:hypothetical protein
MPYSEPKSASWHWLVLGRAGDGEKLLSEVNGLLE